MLPTSFEALADDDPELQARRRVLRQLDRWRQDNPREKLLDPTAVRKVSPEELASTLELLVARRRLQRVYKVISPQGTPGSGEFDRPDIEPGVTDTDHWGTPFETDAAEVVPFFKGPERK